MRNHHRSMQAIRLGTSLSVIEWVNKTLAQTWQETGKERRRERQIETEKERKRKWKRQTEKET